MKSKEKASKSILRKHFVFICILFITCLIYPLVMINVPMYRVFYCDKIKKICEYTEYNIYHHKIKGYDLKMDFDTSFFRVREMPRGRNHIYQLEMVYHGKGYKIFSPSNMKNQSYQRKEKLNSLNKEKEYFQITDGDPSANFWCILLILVFLESIFYCISGIFIKKK